MEIESGTLSVPSSAMSKGDNIPLRESADDVTAEMKLDISPSTLPGSSEEDTITFCVSDDSVQYRQRPVDNDWQPRVQGAPTPTLLKLFCHKMKRPKR